MGAAKTFSDLISEFIKTGYAQSLRERGCDTASGNSLRAMESRLGKFEKFFMRETSGDLQGMTMKVAKGFVRFLLDEQELSAASARHAVSAARSFWTWVWGEEVAAVASNPFAALPAIKGKKTYKAEPLSETELRDLLAAEDEPMYRALWETYAATGARCAEVRELLHKNVNLDEGWIYCRVKGGDHRTLTLTEQAVEALRVWIGKDEHDPESPVWPRILGHRPRHLKKNPFISVETMRLRLQKIAERIGLKPGRMRTHLFRHTFATDLLDMTQNMRIVQEAMGHAHIQTTALYTHPKESDVRKLVLLRGRKMAGVGAVGQ